MPSPQQQQHRSFRPMRQGRLLDMAADQLTSFEHVLIGLICLSPSSGYDLKRIFAATPMGIYQPSSGMLYPAPRRLEQKGRIGGTRSPSPSRRAGSRGRQ